MTSTGPGDHQTYDANGVLAASFDRSKNAIRFSGTVSGGAGTGLSYVTAVAEPSLSNESVFGATVFYPPDVVANRPGAGSTIVGAMYYATDTKVLYRSDGVSAWTALATSGGSDNLGLTPTAVKTANYTVAAGDFVPCDLATTGSFTLTFPTAPTDGTVVAAKIIATSGTRTLSLALGGSDVFNKAGGSTTGSLSLLNQAIVCQYKASSAIWYVVTDDLSLAQLDLRYQPLDSTLTAFAAYNTNGIITQTAADTFVGRTILGAGAINVVNGDGIAGNPTISGKTGRFGSIVSGGHSYTQVGGNDAASADRFDNFTHRIAAAEGIPADEVQLWGLSGAMGGVPYRGDGLSGTPAGTQGIGELVNFLLPNHCFAGQTSGGGVTGNTKARQSSKAWPALFLLMYGINDPLRDVNDQTGTVLNGYKHGIRVALSTMRASRRYFADNKTVDGTTETTATLTGTWTQKTDKNYVFKRVYQETGTNGDSVTITLPSTLAEGSVVGIDLLSLANGTSNLANAISSAANQKFGADSGAIGIANYGDNAFPTSAAFVVKIDNEEALVTTVAGASTAGRAVNLTTTNGLNTVSFTSGDLTASDTGKTVNSANVVTTSNTTFTFSTATTGTISQNATGTGTVSTKFSPTYTLGTRGVNGTSAASHSQGVTVQRPTDTALVTLSGTCGGTVLGPKGGSGTTVSAGTVTVPIAGQGSKADPIQSVIRISVSASDAGKTIILTLSGIIASDTTEKLWYCGWHIEDPDPPPVLLYNQPYFAFGGLSSLFMSIATTVADAFNGALSTVQAEFDSSVALVDAQAYYNPRFGATLAVAQTSDTNGANHTGQTLVITPVSASLSVIGIGSVMRAGGGANGAAEEQLVTAIDKTNGGANDGNWLLTTTRNYNGVDAGNSSTLVTSGRAHSQGSYIFDCRPFSLDRIHPSDLGMDLLATVGLNTIDALALTQRQTANSGGLAASRYATIKDGGYYAGINGQRENLPANLFTLGVMYAVPLQVTQPETILSIATFTPNVTAGTSGRKLRFGIYADANGIPGALVMDCGLSPNGANTVNSLNEVTGLWVPRKPGWIWLVACPQTGTWDTGLVGTDALLFSGSTANYPIAETPSSTPLQPSLGWSYTNTAGVTSSFPQKFADMTQTGAALANPRYLPTIWVSATTVIRG